MKAVKDDELIWIPTCCNGCGGQTGILAGIRDGEVVKIKPNSENPIGVALTWEEFQEQKQRGGRVCLKGVHAPRQWADPERLTRPLLRKGPRGSGQWQTISWEEALALLAERLEQLRREHGPESLLWFCEDHSFIHIQEEFCRAYGTPNFLNHTNICDAGRRAGFLRVLGIERPLAHLSQARVILLLGWNPLEAVKWMYLPAALEQALDQGARLFVADPVRSKTACRGHWLPVRPGTDGALVLALCHILWRDGKYQRDFVQQYTSGWDEFAVYLQDKTPAWAAELTGLEERKIEELAALLAEYAPRVVVDAWCGVSHYSNGMETTRAVACLNALLGTIDRPGGLLWPERFKLTGRPPQPNWPQIASPAVDGRGAAYPFAHKSGSYVAAREAILSGQPYQPRAAVVVFQNLMLSLPNVEKSEAALRRLDFLAVCDVYLSETALLADLVLPGTHFYERYDLTVNWTAFPSLSLRQPVVEPRSGIWPEYEWILELARKLSLSGFDLSYQQYLDWQVKQACGLSLSELASLPGAVFNRGPTRYEKWRERPFPTESGRIQLGCDWQPPGTLPNQDYPFYMVNWKVYQHTHTRSQNNPVLLQAYGENPLWIHPETAAALGIGPEDRVRVESEYGWIESGVFLTEGIHPRVVGLAHGFGHWALGSRAKGRGAAVNRLLAGTAEAGSGQAILKECRVRLRKVDK
ncbi:molybdopterin-dependent oxidoreductase [Carboxydocella sp. JDF658]|uniref:molybdopterin-containing oxidoreductase family protein n=1 Tax=Carboxydocella sp. JDF658 TaxID=1926600 RepID=UPI0009AD5F34|nr:molybdopterin-dependent oxidoreductase [Carboxydocella sp. JDF658]GAW30583.1 hypothetical protein JDF658_03480 [Carboxydocella sp. JDF658]